MDEVGDVRYIIAIDKRWFWLMLAAVCWIAASYCIFRSDVVSNVIEGVAEKIGESE